MDKGRLEAFSDGVIAIIITIMVLEIKVPHGAEWAELAPLVPKFLSYVLSFVFVGIYWNNHHHLLKTAESVNARILWSNMHLLFWLSLLPFVTGWMGENHFAPTPVMLYGAVLLMAALAYTILVRTLLASHGGDSALARAIGSDRKGNASLALYVAGMATAWWLPWLAVAIFSAVAVIWLMPDRRIERSLHHDAQG